MSVTMRTYCEVCGWYVEARAYRSVRRSMLVARWQSFQFSVHYLRHAWAARNG